MYNLEKNKSPLTAIFIDLQKKNKVYSITIL